MAAARNCSAHSGSPPDRKPPDKAVATAADERVDILRNQFLVLLPAAAAAAMAAVAPRFATSTLFDRPARSTSRRRSAGRLSVVLLLPGGRPPPTPPSLPPPPPLPPTPCSVLLAVDLSEFIMDSRSVLVHTIPDDWAAAALDGSSDARLRDGTGGAIFSHTSMFEYLLASLNLKHGFAHPHHVRLTSDSQILLVSFYLLLSGGRSIIFYARPLDINKYYTMRSLYQHFSPRVSPFALVLFLFIFLTRC